MSNHSMNRTTWPAIPFLQLHDEEGGQNITTSGVFLTWDTIDYKTSHFAYSVDDDAIYVARTFNGIIRLFFEVSASPDSSDTPTYIKYYKNNSAVDGAYSYFTPIMNGQNNCPEHVSLMFADYVKKDDKLQIYADAMANACTTTAHTSRLILEFLPFHGWNNDFGGKIEYRGGVLR